MAKRAVTTVAAATAAATHTYITRTGRA